MRKKIGWDARHAKKKPQLKKGDFGCPFCNFEKLESDGSVLKKGTGMLWIKNRYPILLETEQTLIIEAENCDENLKTFSNEYAVDLFRFAFEAKKEMENSGKFEEVLFFKNSGKLSGGSVHHAHMQLIGMKKKTTNSEDIWSSLEGISVRKKEDFETSVSLFPLTDKYEFQITWKKGTDNYGWVEELQNVVNFLEVFKNGEYTDYNLVFLEAGKENIMKIIPRGPTSVLKMVWNLIQVPTDIKEVAIELKESIEKNN